MATEEVNGGIQFQGRKLKLYRVVCEADWEPSNAGCSGSSQREGASRTEAGQLAKEDGWKMVGGRLVCPPHVEAFEREGGDNG